MDLFRIGTINLGSASPETDYLLIVIGEGAWTTAQREQVEGYAAWFAGLEANLSSTHPYKLAPPQTHTHRLADIGGITASVTEVNYVDGVTSAIQTQLDGKQATDAFLDDIAALTDPGADRLLFWDESANAMDWLTAGTGTTITNTTLTSSHTGQAVVNVTIGDGTNVIPTGIWCDIRLPNIATTITRASLFATKPGGNVSLVVDLWRDSFANYPPTDADSITSATPPTLSADEESEDTTLSSWLTSNAALDIIRVNVDSASTVTLATLVLHLTYTLS
jgi:hypothetical protein